MGDRERQSNSKDMNYSNAEFYITTNFIKSKNLNLKFKFKVKWRQIMNKTSYRGTGLIRSHFRKQVIWTILVINYTMLTGLLQSPPL